MSSLLATGGDPPTKPRAEQPQEQQEAAHQLVTVQGPHIGHRTRGHNGNMNKQLEFTKIG